MENRRVRAALIALALVFVSFFAFGAPARAETDGMIRVKLTRLGAPGSITMTADCDYYLAADPTVRIAAGESATVSAEGGALTLILDGGRVALGETAKLMRSKPGDYGVRFTRPELSNRFCGDLGLSASGGVITAILNIYIENYLYGVVGYEMPPSSGIEALKAQAVAARTYALRRRAVRSDAAYDVTDTASDQLFKGYSGASEYANVIAAVDGTRGDVLYYGDSLAQCYTCASNGGQTESARNAWGTVLAYSVVKDDPYDLESTAAVKTAVINKDLTGMNAALKSALVEGLRAELEAQKLSTAASDIRVNAIESVTACNSRFAAPSRLYKSLTFKLNVTGVNADGIARTGTLSVSIPTYGAFEDWYDLSLNAGDTETVWVTESERAFSVSFRRQGSGVGMSQRGAQVMAGSYGKRMAEILEFYYPGTTGRRLELADATRDLRAVEPSSDQTVIATARLRDKTDLLNAAGDAGAVTATVAAGAVVDVYAVQGDWAAVGAGGKYGFVRTEGLASFTLSDATVVRAEEPVSGRIAAASSVLELPVRTANAVASVRAGERVSVRAWTDAWAMVVTPDGAAGFVPMDALAFDLPEAAEEDAEPASPDLSEEGAVVAADDLYGQLRQDTPLYRDDALSDAMDTLYLGSVVKVTAYGGEWALVRTQDGLEGYLPLSSIRALDSAQLSAATDPDTDGPDDGGAIRKVSGRKYLYVQSDGAKVYASWSTDSEVLETAVRGERVRLGAYNARWACVRIGGTTGYMRLEDLSDQAVEGGAVSRAGEGVYAVAVRADVPVYESWSSESRQIAALNTGDRVQVDAYNAVWALVRSGGATGCVAIADLKLEDAGAASGDGIVYEDCDARTTAALNLYASAKSGGKVLARVPKGATVRVAAWNGDFAYVTYAGKSGFVKLKYLERIRE